jgi:hypothetical protein
MTYSLLGNGVEKALLCISNLLDFHFLPLKNTKDERKIYIAGLIKTPNSH